jgi:prolyl 4-hydroxylase
MPLTLRSTIEYALLLIPAYIFILSPLQAMLFGSAPASSYTSLENVSTLVLPSPNLTCPPHAYSISILSHQPLVIVIPDFLFPSERSHILAAADPQYNPSPIYHGTREEIDTSVRNSSRAMLPRDDTVQCIEKRALEFQGLPADVFIERIWAQKYETGGHYAHHFDWSGELASRGAGRISTFMVYVQAPTRGGGTEFPRLERPPAAAWCEVLECQQPQEAQQESIGVTFKPRAGSAVYWENFQPNGKGWEELWHAGMPIEEGTKVGLNIWSWYQPGYTEVYEKKLAQKLDRDEKEEL